jgi:hypothetical protein
MAASFLLMAGLEYHFMTKDTGLDKYLSFHHVSSSTLTKPDTQGKDKVVSSYIYKNPVEYIW